MTLIATGSSPAVPVETDRPPGERYYRHPGDIVRLCVWATATILLLLFVVVASDSSDGVRSDLADAAGTVTLPVRQLLLAGVQVNAVVFPLAVVAALVARRRWRRLGTLLIAAAAGAAIVLFLTALLDDPPPVPGAIAGDAWLLSTRFPTLSYLGAAAAAATVGKPWLSRRWRRAVDVLLAVLGVTMALAGSAGVPELLLAAAAGGLAGTAVLIAVGAPNRRPSPATIRDGLTGAGIAVQRLDVERAVGGRAQLYRVDDGGWAGVRQGVQPGQSRRRSALPLYRTVVLRDAGASSTSSASDVEHEALLLLLAERGGVACPAVRAMVALPDGSTVLAMEDVGGCRLDTVAADDVDAATLDAVWTQVDALHRCGVSHGALRAANVLVTAAGVRLIDLGAGSAAPSSRDQAIDRAELLASLASIVGPAAAVASAARVLATDDLAAAMPYLQPLALSAATRRAAPKSMLRALRGAVAETSGRDQVPLEQLVRIRPRTVVMIATLTGAFYILLPQLANVDDSVSALGSANWWWLAGAVAMSAFTYVAGGGRHDRRRARAPAARAHGAGRLGVVVRQSRHAGQRRWDGAQRPLHAEGRDPADRSRHRRRPERRRRRHRPRRATVRLLRVGHARATPAASRYRAVASSSSPSRSYSLLSASSWRPGADGRFVRGHVVPSIRQSLRSIASVARLTDPARGALRRLARCHARLHHGLRLRACRRSMAD